MKHVTASLLIILTTISACSSEKKQKSTPPLENKVEEMVSSHFYDYAYIDKLDILHLDYLSVIYDPRYERKKIDTTIWVLCPHINLGYKRVPLDSLNEADIQYLCPYCVTKETYPKLFLKKGHAPSIGLDLESILKLSAQ